MGKKGSNTAPRLLLAARLKEAGVPSSPAEKEAVRQTVRARGLSVPMSEFLKPRFPPKK